MGANVPHIACVRAGAFGGSIGRGANSAVKGRIQVERGGESEGIDTKTVTRISFFKLINTKKFTHVINKVFSFGTGNERKKTSTSSRDRGVGNVKVEHRTKMKTA